MSDFVKPFLGEASKLTDPTKISSRYPTFVAQVLRSKDVADGKTRVNISDGQFYLACIYKAPPGADKQTFTAGEIIRVTDYSVYVLKDKVVCVFQAFEALAPPVPKIGDPTGVVLPLPANKTSTPVANSTTEAPQHQQQQQQRSYNNSSAKMQSGGRIYPISEIGPYSNNWTIRARVTNKGDIRTFSSGRGDGKLFNVTLADESGEIRATGFTDVVDELYDKFQVGKTYYISDAGLKMRNEKFNNVKHDYEMNFRRDSKVRECEEDVKLPPLKYNFTQIADLPSRKAGDLTDVIGVLRTVGDTEVASSKTTGRTFDKREIYLVDESNYEIRCTLWGKQAASFSSPAGNVIAIKDVKVSDFGGCTLSVTPSSNLSLNPDIQQAFALKGWYDAAGINTNFNALAAQPNSGENATKEAAPRLTFNDVKDKGLGNTTQNDYFTLRGFVGVVGRKTMVYPACVNSDTCRKKMQESGGEFHCLSCNIRAEVPFYRYALSVQVVDHTGAEFMSAFDQVGESILGVPASAVGQWVHEDNKEKLDELVQNAIDREYVFRCAARQESYNDNLSTRFSLYTARPVDYDSETEILLKQIEQYL